mgnify:CR=1 FL=1|tara:strand:- start:7688 stop:9349 length:1662 start_codon:yes stop_codon:yes gene_type:complete
MNNTIEVPVDKQVVLPAKRLHEVPRLLMGDAYTVGSNKFESEEAKDKSSYYITYRRTLHRINPAIYAEGDERMFAIGLQVILDQLFYRPITHQEIDETKRFLAHGKITSNGFEEYEFPEAMWRRVVDEFNGRPPIKIKALPEGSVVYPNEPLVQIDSQVKGMGVLAAWFESKLLQMWAPSERVTQSEHMILRIKERLLRVDPDMTVEMQNFWASIMITDFGDRAGICSQESIILGMVHLYSFGGTDTLSGAYQAFMNSGGQVGVYGTVNALAHRNVQAYPLEQECYQAIYDSIGDGQIASMVDDCYDAKYSVQNYLLPLALNSLKTGNGKVVVARPDSFKDGYSLEDQTIEICETAVANGLYETITTSSGTWKTGTLLKFLNGDGRNFEDCLNNMDLLIDQGYAFHTWGLFGMGGGFRNALKRDNLSAKYAISAVGEDDRPVVKFSETVGKGTLPGPFKVLRSKAALANKKTVVFEHELGEDAMVEFFNGANIYKPFSEGQDDDFPTIKARIKEQMDTMPLNLRTEDNHGYPASDEMLEVKRELLIKYAPAKA